jgi:FkbM family methyltransferase
LNRVLFFKKIATYGAKVGLGKSQKFVNLYEEMLSKIGMGIRSEFVKIGEQKLFLDKEDSLMLSIKNNEHENLETEYVKRIIQKGDTVIDLGANIGYYTLIFAKLVGKLGHVFAFEPEPSNFELLSKNVKENKHENVTLVQKATSNKNSKIKLYVSKRNLASHRIFDAGDKRKSIEIDVITLNEYFKKNTNPIKIIKMDIEGAEGATLLGASKIIENSKDIIIMMEYFPKLIKKFGMIPKEILKSLIEKNFKLFNMNQKNKKLDRIILTEFIEEFNEEKKNYANLLCIKGNDPLIRDLLSIKF